MDNLSLHPVFLFFWGVSMMVLGYFTGRRRS